MTIKLAKTEKEKIINGKALYEILQKVLARETLIDRQKEHLWVAGLDLQSRLIVLELVSLGNDWMTTADPVAVFARALQKECKHVVIAHNHTRSTIPKPSKADIEATQRMVATGKFVKCPVLDHLIITPAEFYSMRQHGHITQMEKMDIEHVFDDLAITKRLLEMQDKEFAEQKAKAAAALAAKNKEVAELKKQLAQLKNKPKK
jgi:DNA repair protein RadC